MDILRLFFLNQLGIDQCMVFQPDYTDYHNSTRFYKIYTTARDGENHLDTLLCVCSHMTRPHKVVTECLYNVVQHSIRQLLFPWNLFTQFLPDEHWSLITGKPLTAFYSPVLITRVGEHDLNANDLSMLQCHEALLHCMEACLEISNAFSLLGGVMLTLKMTERHIMISRQRQRRPPEAACL